MEQLEVWEETTDQWRWRYRAEPDIALESNLVYDDREQAEHAARHAYPDVALEAEPEPEPERPDRRWLIVLALFVLAAIGIGILAGRSRTD